MVGRGLITSLWNVGTWIITALSSIIAPSGKLWLYIQIVGSFELKYCEASLSTTRLGGREANRSDLDIAGETPSNSFGPWTPLAAKSVAVSKLAS
jgi:hypothetical protein